MDCFVANAPRNDDDAMIRDDNVLAMLALADYLSSKNLKKEAASTSSAASDFIKFRIS